MRRPSTPLFGAILSFADPITDILTLAQFYRADHKIWFYVGLSFVILPCLVFPIAYLVVWNQTLTQYSDTRKCWQTLLYGFHPFSAAFARLQGFFYGMRIWWRGEEIDSENEDKYTLSQLHVELAVLIESVLESAPQFLLQLYAALNQEEAWEVIQIISLLVSFLSLVWMFSIADNLLFEKVNGDGTLKVKHRVAFFISHILPLGTRLFIIFTLTMIHKWWVIVVLYIHTFVMVTAEIVLFSLCKNFKLNASTVFTSVLYCFLHWIRDYLPPQHVIESVQPQVQKSVLRNMQLLSNALLVLENTIMFLAMFNTSEITVEFILGMFAFNVVAIFFRVFLIRRLPR